MAQAAPFIFFNIPSFEKLFAVIDTMTKNIPVDPVNVTKIKLDRIDYQLLGELQSNARISNNELAKRINLSASACLQRFKKLEEAEYISSYGAVLNMDKLCGHIMVLASVILHEHVQDSFIKFEKIAMQIPEMIECYKVSGQFDYFLRFICTDMDRYYQISEQLLNSDIEISNLSSHMVLDQTKAFGGYPIAELLKQDSY